MGLFSTRNITFSALLLWVASLFHTPDALCQKRDQDKDQYEVPLERLELPEAEAEEGEPIHIEADSLTYLRKEDRYLAEGNVEISRGSMTLRADRVILDNKTRLATAEGNVELFQRDGARLQSEQLELHLEDETGRILNGTLIFPEYNLTLHGEEIERLSDDRYRIAGGTLTTCGGKTPDWRITAKEMELTIEGYAKVKHATFDVRKVPILYLPYFVYPTKAERQTGFLMPSFRASEHVGFGPTIPFFWAFHQSWDATFTQTYYTKSGYQQGVELRYAPSKAVEGYMYGEYLRDHADLEEEVTRGGEPREKRDRWRFQMEQRLALPWDVDSKTGIDIVSDNYYLEDLYKENDERYLRYLISTVNATKRMSAYLLAGELEFYRSLDAPDDDNDRTPKRLPSLLFHRSEIPLIDLPLSVGWDLNFNHFWREKDGRAEVFSLTPGFSLPISLGNYCSVVPFIRWQENIFVSQDDPRADTFGHLSNYHYGISMTSGELGRLYPLQWGSVQALKHSLQSELRFDGTDRIKDGDFPRDFFDVFSNEELLTLELTQFLTAKRMDAEGQHGSRELARLEIAQSYVTAGKDADKPFRPLHALLEMYLLKDVAGHYDMSLDLEGFYEWYESRLDDFTVTLMVEDDRGDDLRVLYELDEQIKAQLGIGTIPFLDLDLQGWYDFRDNRWVRYGYGITFYAGCWAVNFAHTIRPGFLGTETDHFIRGKIFLKGLGAVVSF
jgi:LPS-assembly protein